MILGNEHAPASSLSRPRYRRLVRVARCGVILSRLEPDHPMRSRLRHHLNRLAPVAVLVAALPGCTARAGDPLRTRASLTSEVTTMLARSAAAWNRGDLDAFMTDYLPGDRTTYVTSRGVVHGPTAIRERYAPRFGAGGVHDSLSFEGLEVDSLAPGVLNVIAYYVLTRGDSIVARGPTSLVMVRDNGRLRIVHDHSS
jgi:ketosteroid isomerase-like protein